MLEFIKSKRRMKDLVFETTITLLYVGVETTVGILGIYTLILIIKALKIYIKNNSQ